MRLEVRLECGAIYQYRRFSKPRGEWCDSGLVCNLPPFHKGLHGHWLEDQGSWNTSYGSAWGEHDTTRWSSDLSLENERCVPYRKRANR